MTTFSPLPTLIIIAEHRQSESIVPAFWLLNEDLARKRALRLSGLISKLNDIFAQLGNENLDIDRVLHTILQGANSLDSVAFSVIMW